MALAPQLAAAKALYAWLDENSGTLAGRKHSGESLTPRLEVLAHANGLSYDVTVRFFVEVPYYVPITMLPEQHGEALAQLIESDVRTQGFATVKPVLPGSAVLEFRDFVWNRSI